MENSGVRRGFKRPLALIIAVLMVMACLPVAAMADEPASETGKQVLDVTTLTAGAFSADMQAGSFVLHPKSGGSNINDGQKKEFPDGTVGTSRINFGGKATTTGCSVEFTVNAAASVKIWWACGGDGRQMTILDASGSPVDTTAEESTKNTAYISTLEIPSAGTYFLGGDSGNNYIFRVEVTEEQPAAAEKVNVLDASTLETFDSGKYTDGAEQKVGDYFTIIWSAKAAVNDNSKTFADDFTGTKRINFGGTSTINKSVIKFTTSGPATVKVWWVCGGDKRNIDIFDTEGTVKYTSGETSVKNQLYISTMSTEAAGTYFLGGASGNNYIYKVEVTEQPASAEVTHVFESKGFIQKFDKGAKADGEAEAYDEYFTLLWSANSKGDTSGKSWADGYKTEGTDYRVNFGGAASTAKNALQFKTSGPATVKIWWACGDDGRQMTVLDASGSPVAATAEESTKNTAYLSTLEIPAAGTYFLGGSGGSNYIFKVEVTEGGGAPAARPDWSGVAAPVIKSVALNKDDAGKVDVTVTALVGDAGADKVSVTMSDASGAAVTTLDSLAEKEEHVLTFTPGASGKYTFSVTATRDKEETAHKGESAAFDFTLPLAKPVVKGATNNGGGSVLVEWNAVKEAGQYVVEAKEGDAVKATATVDKDAKLSAVLTGLEIGKTYTVTVTAKRGGDAAVSDKLEITVTAEREIPWYFAAFGSSTSTNTAQNGYEVKEDGSVSIWSLGGKGKLVPNSTDGIAFYYTSLNPNEVNFKLTGKVHVDQWTYSNGQDGFGLMVSDRVGAHGAGADFWNNSYMAVVTKVEYSWNSLEGKLTDSGGTKYTMRLGIGSQEKIGVTPENLGASNLASELFKSTMTTLETSAGLLELDAGDYNLVDNYTADPGYPPCGQELITDFVFSIEKNPTGYFVSYYPEGSTEPTVVKYYDPEALSHLDPDNVYLGFFASRNAKITVSDIELETIAVADDDRPVEERPITQVTPSYVVESADIANSAAYDLVYYGNADGTLVVKDGNGVELYNGPVKALEKQHVPAQLIPGRNVFTVTMTPDPDYKPGEYEVMADYKPVTITHVVNYNVMDPSRILYVAPDGRGSGTREFPMSIYDAVRVAAPGQTIVLLEGTYNLTSTLTIQRGIDGTADAYITMMADPNAKTRPVLDFNGACAGMVIAGDYWHFYGFDVTRSANGQKGIQVSGNNNILERLFTYRNGNTGIQISRFKGSDKFEDWPADNLILNCSSYLNADSGYEDADGFAAKLTIGNGNRFYGCISAYNADDGWDLYAKVETGSIGTVVIENCLAFKNGWILDEDGKEVNAGNGNGFKMGGESLPGGHTLINSVSFGNKAKGFDSNSCPDIKVYNSTSFNNNSYNVAMYTNSANETNYAAQGILSYKNNGNTTGEQFKVKGAQKEDDLKGENNYYYNGTASVNSSGVKVEDSWFVSVDMEAALNGGIKRNEDGSIDMGGFLVLTDTAPANAGAHMDQGTAPTVPALPEIPAAPSGGSGGGITGGGAATPSAGGNDEYTVSGGSTTTLPVEVVPGSGQELEITVRGGGKGNVKIPVKGADYGTVAVIVHEDGTEEVISGTILTDQGLLISVEGSATVKVENRGMTFTDMAGAGSWAADAVKYVSARGLLTGTATGVFSPNQFTTRGVAPVILYRLVNEPDCDPADFSDVADGKYYSEAVAWAAENGIVNGYADGTFLPGKNINREELATILYRFAKYMGLDTSVKGDLAAFKDGGSVSGFARDAMIWCVENGIINGVGGNVLDPSGTATRVQTAAVIMRLCQKL